MLKSPTTQIIIINRRTKQPKNIRQEESQGKTKEEKNPILLRPATNVTIVTRTTNSPFIPLLRSVCGFSHARPVALANISSRGLYPFRRSNSVAQRFLKSCQHRPILPDRSLYLPEVLCSKYSRYRDPPVSSLIFCFVAELLTASKLPSRCLLIHPRRTKIPLPHVSILSLQFPFISPHFASASRYPLRERNCAKESKSREIKKRKEAILC